MSQVKESGWILTLQYKALSMIFAIIFVSNSLILSFNIPFKYES